MTHSFITPAHIHLDNSSYCTLPKAICGSSKQDKLSRSTSPQSQDITRPQNPHISIALIYVSETRQLFVSHVMAYSKANQTKETKTHVGSGKDILQVLTIRQIQERRGSKVPSLQATLHLALNPIALLVLPAEEQAQCTD